MPTTVNASHTYSAARYSDHNAWPWNSLADIILCNTSTLTTTVTGTPCLIESQSKFKCILIKKKLQHYLQSTVGSQVITQTQEDTAGAAANRVLFNWIRSDPFN